MADKTEQQNTPQLIKASARSLRISPRKMRLVTNLVKDMRVADALTQLRFTNKKGAKLLTTLLNSAVANAENNFSLKADGLFIKTITCDMGQTMKRFFPRARGSAFVIRRKNSHVNVVLEERAVKALKKSRFALSTLTNRSSKKDKPVITKEGSVGVPESGPSAKFDTEQASEHKATHMENAEAVVEQKTGDHVTGGDHQSK